MSTPQPPYSGAQPPQPPPYGGVPPAQPYRPAQPGPYAPAWPAPHGGVPGGPPPFGAPPVRPRPRRAGLIALAVVGALLIIGGVIAAGAWLVAHDTVAAAAERGDCVENIQGDEIRVVACDALTAQYKVLAKIDGVSGSAEANSRCKAEAPETDSYYLQYRHSNDRDDFALCLQKLA